MQVINEDLWAGEGNWMRVVTTNGCLTKAGKLVMGKGAALEAKLKYPYIDKACGGSIRGNGTLQGKYWLYGFMVIFHAWSEVMYKGGFGIFQVKRNWSEDADLSLISLSAGMLQSYAKVHPTVNIRLNFPGIGAGKLKRENVLPLLSILPDNVYVCEKLVLDITK
jgi:hypothetical protein